MLALSERTGIVREGDLLRVVGFEPVWRVDGEETTELQVGKLLKG